MLVVLSVAVGVFLWITLDLIRMIQTPEMIFVDFGRTYFNLDFSAFHISALA